jgi:hypothetical protein
MAEKYIAEMHQAHVEAEEKRKAKEAQEGLERTEKEAARRSFTREGGTEEQFERAGAELRDRAHHQRSLDRDRVAREAQRARSGSQI